jgi:hypothetical protein
LQNSIESKVEAETEGILGIADCCKTVQIHRLYIFIFTKIGNPAFEYEFEAQLE